MTLSFKQAEIQVLFEQYYVSLVEFSWRIVQDDEIARDIVQDVFVKLLEKPSQLKLNNGNAQKSYLYSTVKNASLNSLRKEKVVERYLTINNFQEMEEHQVLDVLIYAETVNDLHKAVELLPEACQKVCRLSYLEEKSNAEIAELCEVSINTVKTHKRRAVQLLRERLVPIYKTAKIIFLFFF